MALELIRTNVKVKTELGDDGEPIARPLGVWRMELLAVSKLKYTQKSIKREFADQLLTNYLSDLFTLETSTSEVRTRTGFATLCCVGPASLFDVPSAGRSPALTFGFHLHVQLCPPRLQRTSSTTREYADTLTLSLSSSATPSAAAHERDRCCNPRGRGEGLASPLKHQHPRGECYAPLRRTSGRNAQVDAPSHRPFVTRRW